MFKWVLLILFLNGFIVKAEVLQLFNAASETSPWPGVSENINHAPPFYVFQNDTALSEYFVSLQTQVTDLCIPATLTNALLFQISQRKPQLSLKIPGLLDRNQVEGAQVVKSFIQYCSLRPKTLQSMHAGINWDEAALCLKHFYFENAYEHAQIHYIRPDQGEFEEIEYEDRKPVLSDISNALKRGAEVIAIVDFQRLDLKSKQWVQSGSHSVNVYGYGTLPNEPSKLVAYIQNSNRKYEMNFKDPLFDVIELDATLPSEIRVETLSGRLMNFDGMRTILIGLVIIDPV